MTHVFSKFKNVLLVATRQLNGGSFERSVIYMCSHDDNGAMGMVINQPLQSVTFQDILSSMSSDQKPDDAEVQVVTSDAELPESAPIIFNGGPVEKNRGFVLHTPEYRLKNTLNISSDVALSATADIVNDIAHGQGPEKLNFCLGYAGWSAGQLENEIMNNSWLVLPADNDIVFSLPTDQRYDACTNRLGLTAANYMETVGMA